MINDLVALLTNIVAKSMSTIVASPSSHMCCLFGYLVSSIHRGIVFASASSLVEDEGSFSGKVVGSSGRITSSMTQSSTILGPSHGTNIEDTWKKRMPYVLAA